MGHTNLVGSSSVQETKRGLTFFELDGIPFAIGEQHALMLANGLLKSVLLTGRKTEPSTKPQETR